VAFFPHVKNYIRGRTPRCDRGQEHHARDARHHGRLVLQHYEQFDSKYKGLIPLKRVYVPAPLEEPSE
jgi:hypothetical protein